MKSLMSLLRVVLNELGTRCRTSTTADYEYIRSRVEHEGLSFLTITLPTFGKDFQKSLDEGRVDRNRFLAFRKKGRTGELPRFLGGFLGLVFDRSTGVLLDEPSTQAIYSIRQITLMWEKILLDCSEERIQAAFDSYAQVEQDIVSAWANLDSSQKEHFSRVSLRLFGDAFSEVDQQIFLGNIIPKHGPGATADKLKGNQKFEQREWTRRLEEYFPAGEFLLPSWRYHEDLARVDVLDPGAERPTRVVAVPKTLKTPRIIAIEPTAMQYVQQGIAARFVEVFRKDNLLRGLIGTDDQKPNRLMASRGSRDGSLATLDLSEASDRVSNQHVRLLFSRWPHLQGGVDACRSRKADVLGHGVIRLSKFASMGSALTFPVEEMVFLTLIFMGIENALSTRLTRKAMKRFVGSVRVYGDDIIIPVDYVHCVTEVLTTFGYVVNRGKSFWTGKFRESCGKEYYAGHDVSIVKVRRHVPDSRISVREIRSLGTRARHKRVQEIVSTVSLRNQFFEAGLVDTVDYLDSILRKVLRHYPQVGPDSPVLGRLSLEGFDIERHDPRLHRPLVKGYVVSTRLPRDPLDGTGALLKFFLKTGDLPNPSREHLERAGRPDAVDIKLRWSSPY